MKVYKYINIYKFNILSVINYKMYYYFPHYILYN